MPLDLIGVDLPTETVRSARLLLRPWRRDDAPEVARACDEAEIARWLPVPSPYTEQDALDFLAGIGAHADAGVRHEGTGISCAMVEHDGGALVGAITLTELADPGGAVFGYWVAAWARGRSYAAEATDALTRWAFDHGVRRVWLLAAVANLASQRTAERAGFRREGVLREARWDREGTPMDMVLYGRLPSDPAPDPPPAMLRA